MLSARTSWYRVLSTPVSQTNSGMSHFAQNKSHAEKQPNSPKLYSEFLIRLKPTEHFGGFLLYLCGFLAALDLSAVHLYSDDRSITSSASKCDYSRGCLTSCRTKATSDKTQIQIEFETNLYKVETHRRNSVGFFILNVAFQPRSTSIKKVFLNATKSCQTIDKNTKLWYNDNNGYIPVCILSSEEIFQTKRKLQL